MRQQISHPLIGPMSLAYKDRISTTHVDVILTSYFGHQPHLDSLGCLAIVGDL